MAKGALRSKVVKRSLKLPKGTYRFKVSKIKLKVQGLQKVAKGPRYQKGT